MALRRRCISVAKVVQRPRLRHYLPLDDRSGPGQSAAEDDHQNVIAGFDSAAAIRLIEGDGDGRGGGVAVAIEIHEEFLDRDFQSVGDRFNDADVGLVRDDAGDVVDR